ncbi:dCTP deaminase [Rhodococcus ruber]|uniref:dCTP deaminase n=1 Tax=Rhodococcus ruber TaxID=1830 RepID=UPI001F162F00|nr:hypothetical protein [Rhodococcus ruber]MCF8785251.1 hypothetical protein [Rhodococcus ruber]
MILSAAEMRDQISAGRITVDPFDPAHLNPNSYSYRLGGKFYRLDRKGGKISPYAELSIGDVVTLEPGSLYLGHTHEKIGSSFYTPSLIGRSSMGRLGLFLQVDADHGQLGDAHQWTLELRPTLPIRLIIGMAIGQVSFWSVIGSTSASSGIKSRYTQYNDPTPSRLSQELLP